MADSGTSRIPAGVIERLPSYLTVLIQLRQDGQSTVSSARLGELTDVNPAQIRRDLTHFGSFGRRGIGYDVGMLVDRIQKILGTDHTHRLALVGAGNLGSAIASYDGLRKHGFLVSAIFDTDPRKVGTRIGDILVRHVDELAARRRRPVDPHRRPRGPARGRAGRGRRRWRPPASASSSTTRRASSSVPPDVTLHNTDPVQELLHTLYYLSRCRRHGAGRESGGTLPAVQRAAVRQTPRLRATRRHSMAIFGQPHGS